MASPVRGADARPLTGRVVLLTGVTAGIGRATLSRLTAAGASVVGCARDEGRLRAVRAAFPHAELHRADIRDDADRAAFVQAALERHGRIDALVNNAGSGFVGLVEEMSSEQVRRVYETNVIGLVDLTRRVLPHVLAAGGGDVVMVSSVGGWVCVPPLSVYCSSKFAVEGFIEGLRREVGRRGVRVSSVNPGPVRTEWLARSLDYRPAEHDRGVRASPGVDPDRVAAAVLAALLAPRARTVAVPGLFALSRALRVQPLRGLTDLVLGATAGQLAGLGHRLAHQRTPGAAPPPRGWSL